MYSKHALKRCQQRAIPFDVCDMVLDYGQYRYDGHGGRVWFLTKKSLSRLEQAYGSDVSKKLEKKKNLYLVESTVDSTIITAGYAYRTRLNKNH